jgi:hypothetical protein
MGARNEPQSALRGRTHEAQGFERKKRKKSAQKRDKTRLSAP